MSQDNKFDQPIAGHDYDGIQEFDNPLPMWWLWTFFGTIIFAGIYYIHYEFHIGPNSDEELARDMQVIAKLQAAAPKKEISAEQLLGLMKDPGQIAAGQALYAGKCASCHGDKGQGLVGPNLTDKQWIHGAKPNEIIAVINKGVLDKGMPPWEGVLKSDEIVGLLAYIDSIKGSNPAGPKAPQGTEYPDYY